MASYNEVMQAVDAAKGPVSAADVAKALGVKVSDINTTLRRLVEDKKWLQRNPEDDSYTFTEAGQKEIHPAEKLPSSEEAGLTPRHKFVEFGLRVGVPSVQVELTAEMVWAGGKYNDLVWVWKAMLQNQVREDLAQRWWHNWRVTCNQGVPPEIETAVTAKAEIASSGSTSGDGKTGAPGVVKAPRLRDYILSADNTPVHIGENLGDMEYEDALALAKLRAAGQARAGAAGSAAGTQPETPATLAESLGAIFKVFQEVTGGGGKGKTVILTQGENGLVAQEVEPGSNIVVPKQEKTPAQPSQWVVEADGKGGFTTREARPGEPIIINPAPQVPVAVAPPPLSRKRLIIHDSDGSHEEVDADQPIIIHSKEPAQPLGMSVPALGLDGKATMIDLSQYFQLEDHKQKKEHAQEMHETKKGLLDAVKNLVTDAGKALGDMHEAGKK